MVDELGCDVPHSVARDREADARRLAAAELRIGGSQGRDADHLTADVNQRATGVAGVDGGARLDRVGKGDPCVFADGTADGADDSFCDAAL